MCFEELQRKLSPTIKRIAWKLNGRYRSFNHDDLYQEALIHLWSDFLKGKLRDKTDSYILQGCYFHLKNYIRKAKERSGIISIEAALNSDSDTTIGDLLGEYWACDDCRNELHNKLLVQSIRNNGFSRRERMLLEYSSRGLTARDIGKRMGVSHVTVLKMMAGIRRRSLRHIDKD